jgi:hypothetical protein
LRRSKRFAGFAATRRTLFETLLGFLTVGVFFLSVAIELIPGTQRTHSIKDSWVP